MRIKRLRHRYTVADQVVAIAKLTCRMGKWQLKFNVSKCNWLIHLGGQHGFGEYTIGGTVIASCNVVRDLGIQFDSHLKI